MPLKAVKKKNFLYKNSLQLNKLIWSSNRGRRRKSIFQRDKKICKEEKNLGLYFLQKSIIIGTCDKDTINFWPDEIANFVNPLLN